METTATVTERDWTEDMEHETGHYLNRCVVCEETFIGLKRRVICRKCVFGDDE